MLNGYVKQRWQSEKITKCRDYIEEIELHWKIASFYPESLPYFCHIFAIKHQNYKKNCMVMSRAAINWNCLSLPISYIIVVDKESKFYLILLYIDIIVFA